jgi:Outer membrane receptor for ferrienterochelin and colicins
MLKTLRNKILCAMLLMLAGDAAHSQVITGTITNGKSQPIADAFIHLLNTNASTVSDAQGNYSFQHIAAGTYNVSVSAVGYADKNEEVVVSTSGANLNIQLTDAMVQLDAVVVTAQKKEESLQNIPLSISAVSSKQVQQYRLWNSKELTAIVPNLYSNNSGDDRNVTSIRGIVTTSYDPAVATYIDGVNQFSLDTYISNLNDIERIEILRGPQGTLYGRNAMGGVVNIITKQPNNATTGFVELNIGNHGEERYSAGIRLPVIKNKLFFGASAMFNKRMVFIPTNSIIVRLINSRA